MTTGNFDARAATWDDDPLKVERANAIAAAIVREVPLVAGMRALEYGCGTGLLSFALRTHFADITMADVSDGMLAVANAKIDAAGGRDHLEAIKLDLLLEPVPGKRFDIIYSAMTLHHIPDTDAILRRFQEQLVRSGILCIADLDTEDGTFHGAGFDGHLGFDRAELTARALDAGFAKVRFTTAFEMNKTVNGKNQTFPVFLMVAGTA